MLVSRRYSIGAAVTLETEASFPELPRSSRVPDLRLLFRRTRFDERPSAWSHHWTLPNGDLWMSSAKLKDDHFLHFPGYADFLMSADGTRVTAYRRASVAGCTIRHLFLDQVVPLALSRRGQTVLHASAVSTPHGALAFVAESGSGKSTLAAAFARNGSPFLTDDCLVLRISKTGVEVLPSYPGLRVWPDVLPAVTNEKRRLPRVSNYSSKRRLAPGNAPIDYSDAPAALRRVYFLGESSQDIAIAPIPARRAMIELVKFNYLYDVKDREALAWQFHRLSALARLPLFYAIDYPRDLARLPDVRRAILEHAAGTP